MRLEELKEGEDGIVELKKPISRVILGKDRQKKLNHGNEPPPPACSSLRPCRQAAQMQMAAPAASPRNAFLNHNLR